MVLTDLRPMSWQPTDILTDFFQLRQLRTGATLSEALLELGSVWKPRAAEPVPQWLNWNQTLGGLPNNQILVLNDEGILAMEASLPDSIPTFPAMIGVLGHSWQHCGPFQVFSFFRNSVPRALFFLDVS